MQYVCSPVVVMDYTVHDTDKLTFPQTSKLYRCCHVQMENGGYSILFHAGVASCIYMISAWISKKNGSQQCLWRMQLVAHLR